MRAASTFSDRLIAVFDEALRTLAAPPAAARPSPAAGLEEPPLGASDRRRSAALMRVNHAGEIAAQALYVGQTLTARSDDARRRLLASAHEEREHLAWCAERLDDLGGRESLLGPFWFAGSALIGAAAGVFGDRRSLGFVAETERQVEAHIADHLQRLPAADTKSAAILRRMRDDEARHGTLAQLAGGVPLPAPVRLGMSIGGGFLRRVAYFL
jgi:ubiquinone biosynthesis monooxygenase Coq7